jgi:hypothetical protein
MRTIAQADILLPQAEAVPEGDGEAARGLTLPVLEHSGRQYVPVFTSEDRLTELAPHAPAFLTVSAGMLGASWPSDELWLAVNPGSETGATLPPQTVRMLPAYAGPAEG